MIDTKLKTKKTYYTPKKKKEEFLNYWEKANKDSELLARWISLYDAVNLIFDKAEEKNIDLKTIDLPPIKIKDYMDSTVDIYHRKLLQDMHKIEIVYSEGEN